MKKLFLFLLFVSALNSFGAGSYPQNAPQSGVSVFTGLTQTNVIVFSPAYTTAPVVQVFGSATNASPITTTVTSSNLTIVVSSTNVSVAWNSYIGYPRLQYGSATITAGGFTTNTFLVPYAFVPTISVEGSTTNGIGVAVLTTTNVIFNSGVSQTLYWQTLGTAYQAGASGVTY